MQYEIYNDIKNNALINAFIINYNTKSLNFREEIRTNPREGKEERKGMN